MRKTLRSVIALLLVLVCMNNIAFVTAQNGGEVINLFDLDYVALDERQIDIDHIPSWSRTTEPVVWNVRPNIVKKADTTFFLEADETVTVNFAYTPKSASVEFGLIAPNGRFYYVTGQNGSINQTISISERGEYRFAVCNNSSNIVSVSGFVEY